MKKILTLCAVLLAAATMSANITNMTCAQAAAAALALADGATGTDTVAVTGYVTNTNGTVSRGQQVFYMDDAKGTAQTFQAYWCNLPANEAALNVGDKVTVTGFLMNYYKSSTDTHTAEMKNGNVVILERAQVQIDTLNVTVCEAVEEALALASGDNTTDFFHLTGVVSTANDANTTYNNQTFYFQCTDTTKLQVYNAALLGDSTAVALGDTVEVVGRLMNYNNTAEMTAAKVLSVKKNSIVVVVDTIQATVAEAVAAGLQLANKAYSTDIYVVTGYVDSIAYAWSSTNNNMSFYMSDAHDFGKTFEAYRAKTTVEFHSGDLVKITGKLQNYDGLIEISNGTAELIQASALNDVEATGKTQKIFRQGQLIILKNGHEFNAQGIQLK